MSKHLRVSSKAMLAVFACLALLCSLFVVTFVASAGSEDDTYTPKRYVTMEVGDSVNPTVQLKLSQSLFDAAETYTIKGMAKVENFGILRGDARRQFLPGSFQRRFDPQFQPRVEGRRRLDGFQQGVQE